MSRKKATGIIARATGRKKTNGVFMYANFRGIHTDDFTGFEKNPLEYLDRMESAGYPFDLLNIQHSATGVQAAGK